MELQVALDCKDLSEAMAVMEEIFPYVDIAELGTPLMYNEGTRAVREIKKAFPSVKVLADMKLLDGGYDIAKIAYEEGADIVTVAGVTNDSVIAKAVEAAREFGKECFVDLISVADIAGRAKEIDALGADCIGVHTSHDTIEGGNQAPTADLMKIKSAVTHAKTSISGGIKAEFIDEIVSYGPDVVIVGSGIMLAEDKRGMAKKIYEAIHE